MTLSERNHILNTAIEQGCWEVIKKTCIITYIYLSYKQNYYQGEPIVSDQDFDKFEYLIQKEDPDNPALNVVGLIYSKCGCCKD